MLKKASCIVFMMMFFAAAFLPGSGVNKAYANAIGRIDMDVFIDSGGNARVTEIWSAQLDQGTEGYRAFSRLGDSSISDFSVSDESGREYTYMENWDTGADFTSKAHRCGINYTPDGLELCWGISEYGDRTYTLKYTINNFVTQYTDAQGVYFNLLNLDQHIDYARIRIHSDIEFSVDNARIWGFGYTGTDVFEDGSIVLDSLGALTTQQYMVVLIRFEENIFETSSVSDRSFDEIFDEAMSDVDKNEYDPGYSESAGGDVFGLIILFCMIVFIFAICIFSAVKANNESVLAPADTLDFGGEGRELPPDDEINYWREIPCQKDLERAYWVAYQYRVSVPRELKPGIVGAILLKWVKQGLITVSKTKKGLFDLVDNNYAVDLTNALSTDHEYEQRLLEMFKAAAGRDNILEAKEFEKWCQRNYFQMESWFSQLLHYETTLLESEGSIAVLSKEEPGIFGRMKTVTSKMVNPVMKTEAIQLKGLKKFLLDFSLIPEREYFEVHVWEEYLIFAQLLGIAHKVEQQFSKLYPNFNQVSRLNTDITTIAVRNFAFVGYQSMIVGRQHADARSYSGSSGFGGGGGSSFSGGGGSSGGSSGGGFR